MDATEGVINLLNRAYNQRNWNLVIEAISRLDDIPYDGDADDEQTDPLSDYEIEEEQ